MMTWLDATLYVGLPFSIITLSMVITFQYLRFPDVTCASTFVLGGAVSAMAVVQGSVPPYGALALAIIAGAAGGLLTALFHTGIKIDKLLSGILSAFAIYSVNLLILRPTIPYGVMPTVLTWWEGLDARWTGMERVPFHPGSILFLLGCVAVVKFFLDVLLRTPAGLFLRALEDETAGASALTKCNIEPWKVQTLGLVLANGLVGGAGAIVSMAEGAANAHRGFDILITGLIAFLMGIRTQSWARLLGAVGERLRLPGLARSCRPTYTTSAVLGALLYYGAIHVAYRTHISPELVKILIAMYVALAIGDYGWARRALLRRRNSARSPALEAGERVSPSGETNVLVLRGVSFSYTTRCPMLDRVDLRVGRSSLVLIDGENGVGKSTLLGLIGGRIDAQAGEITIAGRVANSAAARRQQVLFVNQDPRQELVGTFSVEENIALASLWGWSHPFQFVLRSARRLGWVRQLISDAGLPDDVLHRLPRQLSGGQQQLLNMLLLLCRPNCPSVVLCDEPFNNLDAQNIAFCATLMERLVKQGCAVIVVTHSNRERLRFDQVVRIIGGKTTSSDGRGRNDGQATRSA